MAQSKSVSKYNWEFVARVENWCSQMFPIQSDWAWAFLEAQAETCKAVAEMKKYFCNALT